jgi:hypothetical protein
MTLTKRNKSTPKNTSSSTLSTIHLPWADLGCNPGISATGRPWHGQKNQAYPEKYLNIQSVPRSKHAPSIKKISQLMLHSEIIAVCSQIHTKHRTHNFLVLNLVVRKVTNGL